MGEKKTIQGKQKFYQEFFAKTFSRINWVCVIHPIPIHIFIMLDYILYIFSMLDYVQSGDP